MTCISSCKWCEPERFCNDGECRIPLAGAEGLEYPKNKVEIHRIQNDLRRSVDIQLSLSFRRRLAETAGCGPSENERTDNMREIAKNIRVPDWLWKILRKFADACENFFNELSATEIDYNDPTWLKKIYEILNIHSIICDVEHVNPYYVGSLLNHDFNGGVAGILHSLWYFESRPHKEHYDERPDDDEFFMESLRLNLPHIIFLTRALEFWVNHALPKSLIGLPQLIYYFSKHFSRHSSIKFGGEIEGELAVEGHAASIYLLLENLAKNAGFHGQATGIRICAHSVGDRVLIEFSDNGRGVREDIAGRLFEPFTTSKIPAYNLPGDHGGIGLLHARERMAAMGGTIECEPHGGINGGAKFTLNFKKASLREAA